MSEVSFQFSDHEIPQEDQIIRAGLEKHSKEKAAQQRKPHNIVLKMGNDIKGGLTATIIGNTLHIKLLWVDDSLRGKGFGKQITQHAEAEAIKRGCNQAFVDTASYQAPEFYIACGYAETARIIDYYAGYDRIFYKKDLG